MKLPFMKKAENPDQRGAAGFDPTALLAKDKLDAAVIAACNANADEILAALEGGQANAGVAILAGLRRDQRAVSALIRLLSNQGLLGRAAGWALGQLDSEPELLAAVGAGKLDERENGYLALAVLAARGKASPALAAAMVERVTRELERAAQKLSSLAEKACRVLGILGAAQTVALAGRILAEDGFCDRFEIQRLRREVESNGRDRESIEQCLAPWTGFFADDVAKTEEPAAKDGKDEAAEPGAAAAPQADDDEALGEQDSQAQAIDWKDFAASPQAMALDQTTRQLAVQFGPALDQLAGRAVGVPLVALSGQELAALILQVLPQALPPQMMQVAFSPQAVNAYQALVKYLIAKKLAVHGQDLLAGVKLVREQITASMRSRGILGGPDYSDPDEAKVKPVKRA